MAVTKTVLKKVRQQASVKLIGDGQANITTFDLKLADETLDNGNVAMNITGMVWSTPGVTPIVITRNGNVTQYLSGNDNWTLTQMFGISDTVANSANISIAMPANSLLYLSITKASGFIEPNQQIVPR
jgi:hypothetical protein